MAYFNLSISDAAVLPVDVIIHEELELVARVEDVADLAREDVDDAVVFEGEGAAKLGAGFRLG